MRGNGDYFYETFKVHHPRHGPPTINDEAYDSVVVEVKSMGVHLVGNPKFEEPNLSDKKRFQACIHNFEEKIYAYFRAEAVWEANCKMLEEYKSRCKADSTISEPEYPPLPPHVDLMHVLLRSPQQSRFYEMSMANFVIHTQFDTRPGFHTALHYSTGLEIAYAGLDDENLEELIELAATDIGDQMEDYGWVYTGTLSHADMRAGVRQFVSTDSPIIKVYEEPEPTASGTSADTPSRQCERMTYARWRHPTHPRRCSPSA